MALTVWAFIMLTYLIVFPDIAFRIQVKLAKRFTTNDHDVRKRRRKGGRR